MGDHPSHEDNLVSLKRIEGQIRGIQKMIEEKRYCVDILTQINAVSHALFRVQDKVLERHLAGCVARAMAGRSPEERKTKIDEIFMLLKRFRKNS